MHGDLFHRLHDQRAHAQGAMKYSLVNVFFVLSAASAVLAGRAVEVTTKALGAVASSSGRAAGGLALEMAAIAFGAALETLDAIEALSEPTHHDDSIPVRDCHG